MTTPSTDHALALTGSDLTLKDIVSAARGRRKITLTSEAWQRIADGRACVEATVAGGIPAYGITTGVGSQKDYAIQADESVGYSARLVRAHGTRGTGPLATLAMLRGALTVQLNTFATGASGVRPALVSALLARLQADDWPEVQLDLSVGAADLVPLAQLATAYLAGGQQGRAESLDALAPKEGLSLLSSNCLTLSRGALALAEMKNLLCSLDLAAALSLEGFRGNPGAWGERSDRLHPQAGQQSAGRHLRRLLAESRLWHPGEARFLQDPLSLRCVPQVNGACYAALAWARSIWEAEINSVVDNPAIDLQAGEPFSHGNMETTLLAVCLDGLRLAAAKAVEASGERLHKVQWPAFSGLPTGLAENAGATGGVQFLNLGHLGASRVAAAKTAAMPVTPHYRGQICDGVEDIGGLAPLAVSECERLLGAAWDVAAVEAIVGTWAIAHRGLAADRIGAGLRGPFEQIRALLPFGREGEQNFDIKPVIDVLRASKAAKVR